MSNTNYPGAIDSFYNPTTSDTLATMVHHTLHGEANDAVAAIETKLGTGSTGQTPNTGMYLVGTGSGATKWVSTLTSPSVTTSLLDANNNTWIGQTATGSAVNYVNVTNATTGNAPSIGSAGSDTNPDFNVTSKGSGKVRENGSSLLDFRSSFANFIQSGCIWTTGSGLTASMTGGPVWINGVEYTVPAVSNHTFAASNDTYVDYTAGTGIVYNSVANNAASPSLASNTIRIAKVVTNGSAITSIVQSGDDSLLNQIYNTSVVPLLSTMFENAVTTLTNAGTLAGSMYYFNLAGIKLLWFSGSGIAAGASGSTSGTVTYPSGFFSTITTTLPTIGVNGNTPANCNFWCSAQSTSSGTYVFWNGGGSTITIFPSILLIGK